MEQTVFVRIEPIAPHGLVSIYIAPSTSGVEATPVYFSHEDYVAVMGEIGPPQQMTFRELLEATRGYGLHFGYGQKREVIWHAEYADDVRAEVLPPRPAPPPRSFGPTDRIVGDALKPGGEAGFLETAAGSRFFLRFRRTGQSKRGEVYAVANPQGPGSVIPVYFSEAEYREEIGYLGAPEELSFFEVVALARSAGLGLSFGHRRDANLVWSAEEVRARRPAVEALAGQNRERSGDDGRTSRDAP
jgi:hypothetical protein